MPNAVAHKDLRPRKLRRAPRRSKRDWPTVTGQISLEEYNRFEDLLVRENRWMGDMVREAILLLLKKRKAA